MSAEETPAEVCRFVETRLKETCPPFLSRIFQACWSTDQPVSVCILTEEPSQGGRFDDSGKEQGWGGICSQFFPLL